MACDERRVIAYLSAELSDDDVWSFEEHLVECDECWTAVTEDRLGRQAAERLRTVAAPELRDRVRAAVSLQPHSRRKGRRHHARLVASGLTVAMLLSVTGLIAAHREADPPLVRAVLRLADSKTMSGVKDIDGRHVEMSTYSVDGTRVLLARSPEPFPMPAHAMPLGPHGGEPWMARRGPTSVLCLNRPEHVLMAGRLSPARLLAFARGLGLTP